MLGQAAASAVVLICCYVRLVFSRRKGLEPPANLVELVISGRKTATCRQMKERTRQAYKKAYDLDQCVRLQYNYGYDSLFGWGRIEEFVENVMVCELFSKYPNFLVIEGCSNFTREQYVDEFCGGDENCVVCFIRFTFIEPTVPSKTITW